MWINKIGALIWIYFLFGCAAVEPLRNQAHFPLQIPVYLIASREYLERDVNLVPAYTIKKGDEWKCLNKTINGNLICCAKKPTPGSEWKYCLELDSIRRPFGFFDMDAQMASRWSEGPVQLFESNDSAENSKLEGFRKLGWTEAVIEAICRDRVIVGMTEDQAQESWGLPSDNNRTTTALGVTEQWVYGSSRYLYFTDGVLTAIQD